MIVTPTILPADNAAVRRALYSGTIFQLAATPESRSLVAAATEQLAAEFGDGGSIREAQFRLSGDEFFQRAGRVRKMLYTEPRFHEALRRVVASCGFNERRTAFDPIRVRVVAHAGHANPRAAAVYYAHRDTWYANPQSHITWWIPLHDVQAEETFVFYSDFFARPVPNNSEEFDYTRWMQGGRDLKIGWQNPDAGATARYPGLLGPVDGGTTVSVTCRQAEILLFAGAHFHQTLSQTTGRTRFSLDFRTVDLDDHAAGLGAPNVDNRSTGSALPDYVQP
jgi:hypothetical protein